MRFPRGRGGDDGDASPVDAFWRWWTGRGAAEVERCIDARDFSTVVGPLGSAVAAIHPRLDWELGAGSGSRHRLVVTAAGDPALRAAARRWRRAAPAATETWEYADTRQPVGEPAVLDVAGHTVRSDDVTVAAWADDRRAVVDVRLAAPVLARMARQDALRATFLLLDQVLGEEAVETWVGQILAEGHDAAPLEASDPVVVPLPELPVVVGAFAERFVEDGEPAWRLMEGTARDGSVLLAMSRVPLRPMVAPHLDTHVRVDVGFTDRTDRGLPGPGALDALRGLEEHLEERVGTSGAVLAHETSSGRRTLHLYVDSTTAAAEQVRAAVGGWTDGTVRVSVATDPAWEHVAHLR